MPMSQGAASSGPVNTTGSTTAAVRLRPSLLRAVGIQGAADAGVAVASRLNASAMTNVRFISHSPMRSRARGMRRFSQVVNGGAGVAAAVGDGDGAAEPPDRAAQARVSDAAWAIAQTERLAATHELPSAAVRDSENRMKG